LSVASGRLSSLNAEERGVDERGAGVVGGGVVWSTGKVSTVEVGIGADSGGDDSGGDDGDKVDGKGPEGKGVDKGEGPDGGGGCGVPSVAEAGGWPAALRNAGVDKGGFDMVGTLSSDRLVSIRDASNLGGSVSDFDRAGD
jgi:hypothetical protein